jgi:hypothetical protein
VPPVFDAASSANGTSVSSLSWSHTVSAGSDRGLLMGVCLRRGGIETTNTVSYNSVALTSLGTDVNGRAYVTGHWLVNPASGTNTAACTTSGGTTAPISFIGIAVSFTDVAQANPTAAGDVVTANGNSVGPSTVINSDTSMLIADLIAFDNIGALTPGAGQTAHVNTTDSGGWHDGASSTKAGAAGTTTMSWTNGLGSVWAHLVVRLREAGGNVVPVFLHHYRQQGIC